MQAYAASRRRVFLVNNIIDSIKIEECENIYEPREDSYLLADAVNHYAEGNVLDMGTGTGIQGIIAAKKGCNVTFADINPKAITCAEHNAKANGVNGQFIITDMFSKITDRYNTIIFNPPYLDDVTDLTKGANISLDGGSDGRKYIDILLNNFKKYVKTKYNILLLESSINKYQIDIDKYNAEVVASKRIFFEEMVVLRIGV